MFAANSPLCLLAVMAAASAPSLARATTVVALSHTSHAAQSDLVVRGTVLDKTHLIGRDGRPYTDSRIRVLETLKGRPKGAVLTVRQLGGPTGAGLLRVVGDAQLVVGEEVVLFLADRIPKTGAHVLTAMGQSKFNVVGTGEDGRPLLQRDLDRMELFGMGRRAPEDRVLLSLGDLTTAITESLAQGGTP